MTTPINVPKLGWAMEEGTLVSWSAEDGSLVAAGQPIYVLETDKVENEVDAPVGGRLRHIGVVGEVYPVGSLIAEIDDVV